MWESAGTKEKGGIVLDYKEVVRRGSCRRRGEPRTELGSRDKANKRVKMGKRMSSHVVDNGLLENSHLKRTIHPRLALERSQTGLAP